ncbi:hypothetical protein B0H14DRAFT_2593830 [Mycena olivaceomarginata]|nr:hypothetical protein B0H14DRAFT_2593830 [Mycena olivaceomarginata]
MSHVQAANPQKEAALQIIQKAGKEGITRAEFLELEGYIKSLEDHKLVPRVQIEIILQKARKGKISAEDLQVLDTAAPKDHNYSGEDPPRNMPSPVTTHPIELTIRNGIFALKTNVCDAGKVLMQMEEFSQLVGTEQVFKIFHKPVMFKTKQDKANHTAAALQPFASFAEFLKYPRGDCPITMGIISLWEDKPVTSEWLSHEFHANLVMVIHSNRNPSPGKVLVVGDPNRFNNAHEQFGEPSMVELIKWGRANRIRGAGVFVNKCSLRKERNTGGHCLALALEWMVDLIAGDEKVLGIKRDTCGKVVVVKGYRALKP